jgi:hypothetical protein
VGAFLMAPKQHRQARCATRSGPLGVPAESSVRARYAQVVFLFKVRFWQSGHFYLDFDQFALLLKQPQSCS